MLRDELFNEDDLGFIDAEIVDFPAVAPPCEDGDAMPQLTITEYKDLLKLLWRLDSELAALTRMWDAAKKASDLRGLRTGMNEVLLMRADVRARARTRGIQAFVERIVLAQPGWLLLRPWQEAYLRLALAPHMPPEEGDDLVTQLFRCYDPLPDEAWDVVLRIIDAFLTLEAAERTYGDHLGPAVQILAECLSLARFEAHHVHAVVGILSVTHPTSWRDELFSLARKLGGTRPAHREGA